MRAAQLDKRNQTYTPYKLYELAHKFIDSSFAAAIKPSWINADGSYSWNLAKAAQLNTLPLTRANKLTTQFEKHYAKAHYRVWLEREEERIRAVINDLELRRAEIRKEIAKN